MNNLVFLDTETTGLSPVDHEIWEIAYAVNDGPIRASKVVHGGYKAEPVALQVGNYFSRNGASMSMSLNQTNWHSFLTDGGNAVFGNKQTVEFEKEFLKQLEGATIVAANTPFDTAMLFARYGVTPWHYRTIDIEAYAMGALGLTRPPGLAKIAEAYGVDTPDHTAYNDVKTLRECYYQVLKDYEYMHDRARA